jgi:hypothetical protein
MNVEDLKQIIDNLNNKIWGAYAEHEENFNLSFSFQYTTNEACIFFEDKELWTSCLDEREQIDEDYEDLEQYCIKQFCKLGNEMLILNKLLKS